PQPDREGLGEILVRMALRVPQPQMLDEMPAGRVRPVIPRIAPRGWSEQPLPATPAVQLIGVLHHVPGFVAQDAHALRPGAAFDVEDLLLLELHQPRMREIEGERDAQRIVRAEPFARDPGMRPRPDVALRKLLVQGFEAVLEPGALDGDLEVLEAELEQLLLGQGGPGEFLARHGFSTRGRRGRSMVSRWADHDNRPQATSPRHSAHPGRTGSAEPLPRLVLASSVPGRAPRSICGTPATLGKIPQTDLAMAVALPHPRHGKVTLQATLGVWSGLRPFQPVGVGSGQNWACRLEGRGMMQFVSNYGVWLVAAFVALESVGFPVPAEAALIAAAVFIARTHDSSIWFLVTAASLAAIFGEIVGFWIGRKFGPRLLTRYGGHLGLTERRVRIGHWLVVRCGGPRRFLRRLFS